MSTARRLIPCALGLVVLTAGVAGAHATLDLKTAKADTVVTMTLKVPGEHEPAYTTKVTMEVPAGVSETACAPKDGWTCGATPDASQGRSAVVTWTRQGTGVSGNDLLPFRTRTPNANGTFAFEVAQAYSSGVKDFWDGAAGSDTPAPRLTVSGAVAQPSASPSPTGFSLGGDNMTAGPAPTESSAPSVATTDDEDSFPWLPVGLSGVAVLAGLGFYLVKR